MHLLRRLLHKLGFGVNRRAEEKIARLLVEKECFKSFDKALAAVRLMRDSE